MSDIDLTLAALGWDEQQRMATPLSVADLVTRDRAMGVEQRRRRGFPLILEAAAVVLIGNLADAGAEDPLSERLLLAAVLADLFAAAGCEPPAWITERVG